MAYQGRLCPRLWDRSFTSSGVATWRGGVSKVSGDLRVALRAAWIIATTFLRLARELRREAGARGAG